MKKYLILITLIALSGCSMNNKTEARKKAYLETHAGTIFYRLGSRNLNEAEDGLEVDTEMSHVTFYQITSEGMKVAEASFYTNPETQELTVFIPSEPWKNKNTDLTVSLITVPINTIEGNDLILFNERMFESPKGKYGEFITVGQIVSDNETMVLNLGGLRNSTGSAINQLYVANEAGNENFADQEKVDKALKTERVSFRLYDRAEHLEEAERSIYESLLSETELKDYFRR